MKKLRLDAESLAVETFEAASALLSRATVRAAQDAFGVVVAGTLAVDGTVCDPGTDTCPTNPTCPGQFTCDPSCGKICTPTCPPQPE
ncbi:MAG TPA: hypothetical protein VF092_15045 [Longimicrobium sp.]